MKRDLPPPDSHGDSIMRIKSLSIAINLCSVFFICETALAREFSNADELTNLYSNFREIKKQIDILYPTDDAAKSAALRTSVNRMLDKSVLSSKHFITSQPESIFRDLYDNDVRFSDKLLSMPLTVQIWKGTRTRPGEFPNVVALKNGTSLTCTGTVITENAILTARHCVCKAMTHFEEEGVIRTVPKIDCQSGTSDADLAIIIVNPLVSRPAVRFASSRFIDDARSVTVVGFGRTHQPLSDPEGSQQKAEVVVFSPRCGGSVTIDGHTYSDSDYYGCSYNYEFVAKGGGKDDRPSDTCTGDSGGPAFAFDKDNRRFNLIGVTSRPAKARDVIPNHIARPQGRCGDGGIYVRIDETRLTWIKEQVGPIIK